MRADSKLLIITPQEVNFLRGLITSYILTGSENYRSRLAEPLVKKLDDLYSVYGNRR